MSTSTGWGTPFYARACEFEPFEAMFVEKQADRDAGHHPNGHADVNIL